MTRYRFCLTALALLLALAGRVAGEAEAPARLAPGVELFEAGEYAEALEFFTTVPRQTDGAWVDFYLGRARLEQGEVDAAIERLGGAVEAAPESALFLRLLGEAYVARIDQVGMLKKMGVAKKARTSFEQAVELAPGDPEAREALADYYLNAPAMAGGSREKAEEQAAEMMKLDPTAGHLLAGRILLEDEDWGAAAREFRAAVDAGSQRSRSHYLLGFALQQSESYEAAFAAFETAIEADPRNLGAYYQIGRTAIFSKSNLERAVECLTFYVDQPRRRSSPAPEHAHWRLGMVYELQGRNQLAAAEYRAALEIDPKHKEAQEALDALGRSGT